MKLKKIIKVATGTILAVYFSNGFAMDSGCPSASTVRILGNKFLYAYNTPNKDGLNVWTLLSESYSSHEVNWQTTYTVELPAHVDTPNEAIRDGDAMFSKSPLLTNPASTTTAGKTECLYTTADFNYKVTAISPPPFGLKNIK